MRRTIPFLVLAFLLLVPGAELSGSSLCADLGESCLSAAREAPRGEASTTSEARAPVLERAASPPSEGARLLGGPAAAVAEAPPLRSASSPVSLRELAAASYATPLYLENCSFLC